MVRAVLRCRVPALLLSSVAATVYAAADPIAARIDAIERTSGIGDFPTALRLSAELLGQTKVSDPAMVPAAQARLDVLVDSGEWAAYRADLRAAIEQIPDAGLRDAVAAEYDVAEAASTTPVSATRLLEIVQANQQNKRTNPAGIEAEMHGAAARAALLQGNAELAEREAQAALAFWHEADGVRARRYEIGLGLLLSQAAQLGHRSDEAVSRAESAARIAVATFGSVSIARVHADEQRASVLESQDRFAEARELREGILKATYAQYGEHHLRTALVEAALGAHLQTTADYATAREHFAKAEAIMSTVTNAGPRDRLVLANNYANLLQEMGDEDGALARYRTALELAADNRTRALVLTNIGNTEFRLKRFDAAIADFNQALPLREQAEGKDAPGLSFALEGLGSSALALRRFDEAERYFARAADLRSRNSGPNNSQLNVLNFGLALARWGLGRDADAFRLAVQTAERQQGLLNSLATGFSEQQSMAFDKRLMPATALVVTIAARHGDADEIATAWRLVMIDRGLIARAETRRLAIARASADPQLAQHYRDWRTANAALGDGWTSSRTSAARMSELQAAAEAAERALWVRLGFRQDDPAKAARPVEELARALPKDGVLVAFTEGVGDDPARIVNAGAAQSAEDMYAFALAANGAPALVRIGRIDAIGAEAHAWYGLLRDPHSDTALLRQRGNDLRADLLGRIDRLAGKRTLFVIPAGELFRVSFAALPPLTTADPGDRYWIESGMRVHTLAHEGDLLITRATLAPARVVLAGAPEFGAQTGAAAATAARQLCARVAAQGFPAIPGAARELDGLQGVLRAALGADAHVDLLGGGQATKERVMTALDGAGIVHLATHGFSFDESCGGADSARGLVLERTAAAEAPVTQALSGLAFTGADVGGGHAPIGVLSAGEMSASDLSHADWVALSACDSGLGPIGHSEGVFGMRRALRLAGARTVIMSLWEADDTATAELMQSLYRARFADHRNVPEAMAQAMRETLAARRAAGLSTHPYYWAAFVSEGGWR